MQVTRSRVGLCGTGVSQNRAISRMALATSAAGLAVCPLTSASGDDSFAIGVEGSQERPRTLGFGVSSRGKHLHRISDTIQLQFALGRKPCCGVLFANATGDSQMANTSAAARGAVRSVATRLIRKPPVTVLAACRPMLATGTVAQTTFMLHSTTLLLFLRVIQGQKLRRALRAVAPFWVPVM